MTAMTGRNFRTLLEAQWDAKKFLCVGLDTDDQKIPEELRRLGVYEGILAFNRAIIEATKDIVSSYKPNTAFYEAHGDLGFAALRATIMYINEVAPELPVILDAKRADIGNTNQGYAVSAFDHLGADAITVHPYFGAEALEPFFERTDKGIIVLCRSSNEGSGELQLLDVGGEPLYKIVAKHVAEKWNSRGNCSIMVGATYPDELREVRAIVGDMPILIPGIGAQGGDLEKSVSAGKDARGRGMIISASRAITFASGGPDFAEAARARAQELHDAIVKALS
ncbi:MAG: orotidine-5'-phosphate decarboxylase [Minisyncoccota bacterium]